MTRRIANKVYFQTMYAVVKGNQKNEVRSVPTWTALHSTQLSKKASYRYIIISFYMKRK